MTTNNQNTKQKIQGKYPKNNTHFPHAAPADRP